MRNTISAVTRSIATKVGLAFVLTWLTLFVTDGLVSGRLSAWWLQADASLGGIARAGDDALSERFGKESEVESRGNQLLLVEKAESDDKVLASFHLEGWRKARDKEENRSQTLLGADKTSGEAGVVVFLQGFEGDYDMAALVVRREPDRIVARSWLCWQKGVGNTRFGRKLAGEYILWVRLGAGWSGLRPQTCPVSVDQLAKQWLPDCVSMAQDMRLDKIAIGERDQVKSRVFARAVLGRLMGGFDGSQSRWERASWWGAKLHGRDWWGVIQSLTLLAMWIGILARLLPASGSPLGDVNMVRMSMWCMPSLGFLGTVVGIGEALSWTGGLMQGDASIRQESVANMVGGLALAFDTTIVGLLGALFVGLVCVVFARGEREVDL